MAAEVFPYLVLDLAEGLLAKMQRVLLPRDVLAPPALAGAPRQGGRRWSARPSAPVPGGQPPDSQMAWVKTRLTPGRRATRASQSGRSSRVSITGETQWLLERTTKTIYVVWDRRVASQRARRTAVSTPRSSGSVIEATATPSSAVRVTSILMARTRWS